MANSRLSQILSIAAVIVDGNYAKLTEIYQGLKNTASFTGHTKVYTPTTEDGTKLPSDNKNVAKSVYQILRTVTKCSSEILNHKLLWESGNTVAKASVTWNGQVVLENAPVGFLLAFEKHLDRLRAVAGDLPTYDPEKKWNFDQASEKWTSEPVRSNREVSRNTWIAVPDSGNPDKGVPNEVREVSQLVLEGSWEKIELSASLSPVQKAKLLENIDSLKVAVKSAREEANAKEIAPVADLTPLMTKVFSV